MCPQILSVIDKKRQLVYFFNNMAREEAKKRVSDFLHENLGCIIFGRFIHWKMVVVKLSWGYEVTLKCLKIVAE